MIWLVWGCSAGDPPAAQPADDSLRRQAVTTLGEELALARYRELQEATAALSARGAAFCEALDEPGLAGFREGWWAAHEPWKRAEIVRFGPATEEPYRLQPKIDTWPANDSAVVAYLEGTGGFTQEDFDGMGTATRGFPALEVLLWAEGDATLVAFREDPRRCPYAVGLAADLEALAARMVGAWETEWLERLVRPEDHPGDAYETLQDVIDEWVNRMVFTAEDIRSTKLGKPVGDSSGGEPLPDTLESRHSGRSLQDARDALRGVGDAGEAGIFALLPTADADLAPRIDQALETADAYLGEVIEPLEQAIVDDRIAIGAAQDALLNVQVLLQVDLAQSLSVTLAFNDNDGD